MDLYASLQPSMFEFAISALNAIKGESLEREESRWKIHMGFYYQNRRLKLLAEEFSAFVPAASSKVAIFIHGFSSHEQLWRFPHSPTITNAPTSYGNLLLNDFGFTPLYLRYNSGLHISDNGRRLARLMDQLLDVYPSDIEDIILMGHSLGGLVIRSACHYGRQNESKWISKVSKNFYLGTPHLGTPWEERSEGLYSFLTESDLPLARLVNRLYQSRNAAMRDLRYPHLVEEDWQDDDPVPTTIPWLESSRHHFVAARLKCSQDHPFNHFFGDGLVPIPSAGNHTFNESERPHVPAHLYQSALLTGVNHIRLAHNHEVYETIKYWMEDNNAITSQLQHH